jgi:hypothetical protein
MARLQVIPDESMEAREFFYHADLIQRDIIEEEKRKRMREAIGRANGIIFG